jgi:hypothetical protein
MSKDADATHRVWLAYAEMASLMALSEANRRLMRKQNRSVRGHNHPLRKTDKLAWHTVLPAAQDVEELLAGGTLDLFIRTAKPCDDTRANCVRVAVDNYLRQLLTRRVTHDRDMLEQELEAAGCWDEGPPQTPADTVKR